MEDLPELTEPSEDEDPLDPEADGQMRLGEHGEIVESAEEPETPETPPEEEDG